MPFRTPDDAGELAASDIAPSWSGLGASLVAQADLFGTTRGVARGREYQAAETGEEDLGSQIGRLQAGEDLSDVMSHPRPPPTPLTPQAVDARVKQEGLTGLLPHPSANPRVLDIQVAQAHEERDREVAIARGQTGIVPGALGLVTSLGAGMLDPVNAAAFMIPVGGEAFWGARLAAQGGKSLLARGAVRAVQGGAQGLVGGTALVPADWWLKTQDGQDFTMADALKSVVMSAGMGAGFHAGFGSIGDILARRRGLPLPGSADDLRLRALSGDTHAAELLEKIGTGVLGATPKVAAPEPPGATAAEHPLAPPLQPEEELHPAARVYDDVLSQLRAAGMSQEAAEQNAAIMAARYNARAERLGNDRDAWDLYQAAGLAIRRTENEEAPEPIPPPLGAQQEGLQRSFSQGNAPGLGLSSVEDYLRATGTQFRKETSRSTASLSTYYYVDTPAGTKKIRISDHAGGVGEDVDLRIGADAEDGFRKVAALLGRDYDPAAAASTVDAGRARLESYLSQAKLRLASGDHPHQSPDDLRSTIRRLENQLAKLPPRRLEQAARPVEPGLFADREAEGQTILPGGERISDAELAQRRADQALKPKVAQKPMDVGLFGDESKQKALFQHGEAGPRGRITMAENRAVIDLFAKADRSTFMHETAHLWLEEMIRDASGQNAPESIKNDLKTILDWLGVAKPEDIATEHHEQWARGFERYLAEGKAPSSRLAQAFEKFKAWLSAIYHSLASIDAPLSDDVRGVMDRMLATDEEIAEARAAPPHPAEALADLPPRAREDAMRVTGADLIAGRPVRAAEMLAEAAKESPRIAESLEPKPVAPEVGPAPVRTGASPKIDNTHDIVSGANSSRDPGGPVYIDRHIPQFSPTLKDRNGNPANLHRYLALHEEREAELMAQGMAYDAAHIRATRAERAAVEADGVDWKAYTHEIDGYLSSIEHEHPQNAPPAGSLHVDPRKADADHHRSSSKQVPARTIDTSGLALALPVGARTMIDDPERYKLNAKLRREKANGGSAVTVYETTAARERAHGRSAAEGRAQHEAATQAFDAAVAADERIGAADVPDEVRALAIEVIRERGMDPAAALDYATARIEQEALRGEDLSDADAAALDGISADRHVIATEDGHGDLHGDIPFGAGEAVAPGRGQEPGQAGQAAAPGGAAREARPAAPGQTAAIPAAGRRPVARADFRKLADAQHPVADQDLTAESKAIEKLPEPASVDAGKAVTAAEAAAAEADKLLADILPGLTDDERKLFEAALNTLDQDRAAREQMIRDGAACLMEGAI